MRIIFIRLFTLIACIIATIAGAILLETFLDFTGLASTKHIIGTIGSALILISIAYSLRKRKIVFQLGHLKQWLVAHEWLAIVGSGLVFVHGGFHGHALVPLLTTVVMLVTVISGLTGRYLYLRTSEELKLRRREIEERGLPLEEVEDTISSLVIAHGIMRHWRTVHVPIVFILAMTVTFHILSSLYYDGLWG